MAKADTQYLAIMAKIDKMCVARINKVKSGFNELAQEMMAEFRSVQYARPQKDNEKRNKSDGKENKSAAIAYAQAHAGDAYPNQRTGWINWSFRAASGVHPYIDANPEMVVLGLKHTVSYGAYLEYAHNRKYAVIEPLIRKYAPKAMKIVKEVF